MTRSIVLEFESFSMNAKLFDTPVADSLYQSLPQQISLTHWGKEMYGSVQGRHGEHQPVPRIPEGGLAYTDDGQYFCIFFGQNPAWPVEHVGRITDGDLSPLHNSALKNVTVKKINDR
ncbi:MAG: hypothetical protein JXR76_09300 [Deltaproteobacteria bacterium]|nr:hypothetical protein [Deltaproteobacteria bacterium]